MYGITDLKKGTLIEIDGSIYRVRDYHHASMGRGGAVVRTKLRNVQDGSILTKTFKGSDKITPAELDISEAEYLYSDNEDVYFMRIDDFEQVSLPKQRLTHESDFLREGLKVKLLYSGASLLAIDLPIKVEYEVAEADPGIKGDSASNITKNCRIETGRNVQVPLFVEAGDRIVVDTRDGSYVERVS